MKFFLSVSIVLLTLSAIIESNSGLSEVSKLKAENFKLRAQLAQCSMQITNAQLATDQTKLIESFRKELNANQEDVFDWNTFSFNSK